VLRRKLSIHQDVRMSQEPLGSYGHDRASSNEPTFGRPLAPDRLGSEAGAAGPADTVGGPTPPASSSVDHGSGGRRSGRSLVAVIAGSCFIIIGLAALVARIVFVRWGILYGTSAVSHVDAIVGALIAIGVALIAWGWKGASGKSVADGDANHGQPWTGWVSGVTALVAAGALVVSLMNLLEPLNPPRLATSACPGARDSSVPYVGITSGLEGDNSRLGPARSYPANGRFPAGCSIGFSVYCLGDPILDETGSTSDETWVTSRWLLVAKQPGGWRSDTARILSGENPERQFVSDAFVTPETAYDQLPLGGAPQCPGAFPYPGKTSLQPFDAQADTFTATASHATNMGLAVWVPPQQGFLNSNAYLQIFTPGAGPANNPGEAAPNGSKSVEWDYKDTLLSQFEPTAGNGGSRSGHVVILAVACLADNIPAFTSTAFIVGYVSSKTGPPTATTDIPNGLDKDRLARAACEAST